MSLSLGLKVKYSLYSALIFFLVANTATFKFVNTLLPGVAVNGCPTSFGLLLHTFVFFLALVGIMMLPKDKYD
jgi:glucan phosphoethanolaminetransferase (alkaline phosphatase superfamily)